MVPTQCIDSRQHFKGILPSVAQVSILPRAPATDKEEPSTTNQMRIPMHEFLTRLKHCAHRRMAPSQGL